MLFTLDCMSSAIRPPAMLICYAFGSLARISSFFLVTTEKIYTISDLSNSIKVKGKRKKKELCSAVTSYMSSMLVLQCSLWGVYHYKSIYSAAVLLTELKSIPHCPYRLYTHTKQYNLSKIQPWTKNIRRFTKVTVRDIGDAGELYQCVKWPIIVINYLWWGTTLPFLSGVD